MQSVNNTKYIQSQYSINYQIMMANIQANHHIISISRKFSLFGESNLYPLIITPSSSSSSLVPQQRKYLIKGGIFRVKCVSSSSDKSNTTTSALVQQRPPSTDEEAGMMIDQTAEVESTRKTSTNEGFDDSREIEYLVEEYGWKVRRMLEDNREMRKVAQIQAEAFHSPAPFFDDWFFQFFKAEVLAGLLYKLRNSPPDRYACLVAEPAKQDDSNITKNSHPQKDDLQLVGVVDVTALRDNDVLLHLEGAQEYLYISGIAVLNNFRRRKVATVLLKACEVIAILWGFDYLALRAYEDDWSARSLYTNAGYRLVSRDPIWVTWIGRKRRILMIKQCY